VEQLRRYARGESNRAKDTILASVMTGALEKNQILPRDKLQLMVDHCMMSPEQLTGYMVSFHGSTAPEADPQEYSRLQSVILRYDPGSDPQGDALLSLRADIAGAGLPPEQIRLLGKQLGERESGERTPRHKLAAHFAEATDDHFSSGDFGGGWLRISSIDSDGDGMADSWDGAGRIDHEKWQAAVSARAEFQEMWDGYLESAPPDLDLLQASEVYGKLLARTRELRADTTGLIPASPAPIHFNDPPRLLAGTIPQDTGPPAPAIFGGRRVKNPGSAYRNAIALPASETPPAAASAGGSAPSTPQAAVILPGALLDATFPGKDPQWLAENAVVVVRTADGREKPFPVVRSSADDAVHDAAWQHAGRPALELTPAAIRRLGGTIGRDPHGKVRGVRGLEDISFSLTTPREGISRDLSLLSWRQAQALWFRHNRPGDPEQIASNLTALRAAWQAAQTYGEGTAL
jgi:hypothetical protein